MRIGFIGSGKMAEALIKAIIKTEVARAGDIVSSDVDGGRLGHMRKEIGINVTRDNKEVMGKSDIVFLAVKPQNMGAVLGSIKSEVKRQLIVSIAAGITLKFIESKISYKRIVRVMPNTPCLVGEMAAGYALGKGCTAKDARSIDGLLNSAGIAIRMEENMLDAVTGLSGSGPAFAAYMIDAMIEAGKKEGLSKDVARELALQTFFGTAKLLQETGLSADELIAMVRSPKGTTHEGMKVLESSDVKRIIKKAVEAATKKSKELGKKQ